MKQSVWDCLMVGAGPASLAAAVYTARENIKTLVLEKSVIGGLAAVTSKVDNYPGFADGVAGLDLATGLQKHALRFGATIDMATVTAVRPGPDNRLTVSTADSQRSYLTKSLLLATGSEWLKLQIPGEADFYGRGVHHCATCDGAFYQDQPLVVVGSGNTSAQESLFLTRYASQIDILIRGPAWKASSVLVDQVMNHPKIKVHFNSPTQAILADGPGDRARLKSVQYRQAGTVKELDCSGVFVFIGLRPVTGYLTASPVVLDPDGFIVTNQSYQTNISGIFAAGDVRSGATMQIASAIGEGASAALSIRHYLDNIGLKN